MNSQRQGGIDFDKLEATHRQLGLPDDMEEWPEEFNDPAFSRRVLGLEDDGDADAPDSTTCAAADAGQVDLYGVVRPPGIEPGLPV